MRRDHNDKKWQLAKSIVTKRDNNRCRLCKVLTPQEFYLLKRNAGYFLNIIDPAHVIPVSDKPELIYDYNNIVSLNRYSHSNLDNFRHPLTGEFIGKEACFKWWMRILSGNKSQLEYLKNKGLIE